MTKETMTTPTRAQVRAALFAVLAEVQSAVGAPAIEITDNTKPIGDVYLFDSILSEDTSVAVFQRLGLDDLVKENPFIADGRAQAVKDIVERLCKLVGATEQEHA